MSIPQILMILTPGISYIINIYNFIIVLIRAHSAFHLLKVNVVRGRLELATWIVTPRVEGRVQTVVMSHDA